MLVHGNLEETWGGMCECMDAWTKGNVLVVEVECE